jgi:hypothetical protein
MTNGSRQLGRAPVKKEEAKETCVTAKAKPAAFHRGFCF